MPHSLPTWLVSAPHRRTVAEHPARPYEQWHARKLGADTTACGQTAANWPFFWGLRFSQGGMEMCPVCAFAVEPALA